MSNAAIHSLPNLTLVLGGQRSGKSAYAEGLFDEERQALYIATCEAWDEEMSERIERHQGRRGQNWQTVEETIDLAQALLDNDQKGRPILVDSLAMWVSNLLDQGYDVESELFTLVDALENLTSAVVIVSDETGLGIIPDNALAREFLDELGAVNQTLAARADNVIFVAAGLPLTLKS